MNQVISYAEIILTTYKMFNSDDITTKNDNKGWPYRTLVLCPPGSGKTNYLLNKTQKDNNITERFICMQKIKNQNINF